MAFTLETQRVLDAGRLALSKMTDQQVRDLVTAWATAWDTLEPEYRASIEALLAGAKDGKVSAAKIRANTRLKAALELTKAELDQLAEFTRQTITATLPEAVNLGGTLGQGALATQMPPGHTGLVIAWDTISPETIAAMVARSTEQIHAATWPLAANAEAVMKRELIRGVSVGAHPRETARRIIKQTEQGFNGGLNRALTIARTETLDAHRAGTAASAKQNREVLSGWRWTCSFGPRTCPACLSMHGREFTIDEPGPHGHQNCRCVRIDTPKTWRELGFDIDEPKDTFPDARAWYDNLTPESQTAVLGKARRDLLDRGEINWESLATKRSTPGWRDSWGVTPLKDLV